MANAPRLADDARNAAADGIAAKLNSGYLRIYDGSRPATVTTAVTTQVKLAELRFQATAFLAALVGVAVANPLTPDANTVAGIGTWFRCLKSDGTTVEMDGSVGVTDADLLLNTVNFIAGGDCEVDNFFIQEDAE